MTRIAALQMVSAPEVGTNLDTAERLADQPRGAAQIGMYIAATDHLHDGSLVFHRVLLCCMGHHTRGASGNALGATGAGSEGLPPGLAGAGSEAGVPNT